MTVTLTIDHIAGTAVFSGLTPADIGAVSQSIYNALATRVTTTESNIATNASNINTNTTSIATLNTTIQNLSPSSVKLSNIAQNVSNGQINLNNNVFVDGQVTAYAKLETRLSEHGLNVQPWSEANRWSARLDIWSTNDALEHEVSVFRDTYGVTGKAGIAIYRPDRTDNVNHYIAGYGNTYFCRNNGYMGVGTTNPLEILHVSGGYIRCSTGIKLGSNLNRIDYGTSAPTSGTYLRGDRVINQSPSASGNVGWVCVSAGSPGTWKTYGTISA